MKKCNKYQFKYAGVQYNYQCWCGNSYGNYEAAYNCHMRCPNNTIDFCGGAWSNDIYEIIPNNSFEFFSNKNETTICNKQVTKINCPLDQLITVTYAMFGRISIRKCQFGNYKYDKCSSIKTDFVGKLCNNRNSCDVYGSLNLDDPCPDISKYLDVTYACSSMNVLL